MTTKQNSTNDKDAAPDIDVILPEPSEPMIIGGIEVRVNRIRTREFIALMRVITTGLGPSLSTVSLDFSTDGKVAGDLAALMLLAVPQATEETFIFLATIVQPTDDAKRGELGRYMSDNPDLDEMLAIFEKIAEQEAGDLRALAGKAQAMWKRIAPMYQMKMAG